MKFSYENIFTSLMILLVFSLAFVFPFVTFSNQRIPFTDFIFIPVFLFWIFGVLTKKITFKFHSFLFAFSVLFICNFYLGNFFGKSENEFYKIYRGNLSGVFMRHYF